MILLSEPSLSALVGRLEVGESFEGFFPMVFIVFKVRIMNVELVFLSLTWVVNFCSKTALMLALCTALRDKYSIAAVR